MIYDIGRMKTFFKKTIKHLLRVPSNATLSWENYIKYNKLFFGKYVYKRQYSADDVVGAMCKLGLKEGSNLIIHCSWDEFYNCTSSPRDLIERILSVIGPEGTLCMPAMPLLRKNKVFNVKKSVTRAGILAEEFRKYPGVKRSINERHSVCAIGPLSDYLLSEHHLGETCWDEKSPYYKLSQIDALVFVMGLGKYWPGTIIHCVEALLRGKLPYYTDMFLPAKTEYKYVDYDGIEKSYWNYNLVSSEHKRRKIGYFRLRKVVKKYLKGMYSQISNLQIARYEADFVLKTLLSMAKRGEDVYVLPSKKGYIFDNNAN